MPEPTLAVYTTIYPGVEPFLPAWWSSVRAQADMDFTLWIGLHELDRDQAIRAIGTDPGAVWVERRPDDTPATIRSRALLDVCERHGAVVLVDSDDVLHPTRVTSARAELRSCDLSGCALRLVDASGASLGRTFGPPSTAAALTLLPRYNAFGFSNSAWRCETLAPLLPVPADAVLVDWYLATRAWLVGSVLHFDARPQMDYRQYGRNTACLVPPFPPAQIVHDTARVHRHFELVLASDLRSARADRLATLRAVARDVARFREALTAEPGLLDEYTHRINAAELPPVWWSTVAHPDLAPLWQHTLKESRCTR